VNPKANSDDDEISKNDGPSRRRMIKPPPKDRKERLEPFDKTNRRIPIDWFILDDESDDSDD
jgi:hypothetical protein